MRLSRVCCIKEQNVGQNEQNVGLQEDKCSVKMSQNVRSFRAKKIGGNIPLAKQNWFDN